MRRTSTQTPPFRARCCTHLRGSHVVIHWLGGSHALASGGHATARGKLQDSTACDHSPAPAPDPRLPGLQFDRLISEGDPKSFLKTDLRRPFAISPFRVFVIPKEITSRKHESRKARKGLPGTMRRLLRVPSSYKGLSAEHFVARSGYVSCESGTVGLLTCVQQRALPGGAALWGERSVFAVTGNSSNTRVSGGWTLRIDVLAPVLDYCVSLEPYQNDCQYFRSSS